MRDSWERNAKEGFVSLQKKMGGMVNEGRRYMDEVGCSVCGKGCEDCWKIVGRIYLKLTFVGRATFSRPGETPGSPSVVFGECRWMVNNVTARTKHCRWGDSALTQPSRAAKSRSLSRSAVYPYCIHPLDEGVDVNA